MTTDYYYNTDWKCVEERDSGETCPRKQYAYGIRGRNDLVARDNYHYNSSSGSPSCSSAGKERHYALSDAMGSVTAVASTAGAVVERYSYTAFGQSQVMDASFTERSMSLYDWQTRFHGEQRDAETGYYNYGYRYYDPVTGRWPSRDLIGELGGLNLYGMLDNDGVNHIDYLGNEKYIAPGYRSKLHGRKCHICCEKCVKTGDKPRIVDTGTTGVTIRAEVVSPTFKSVWQKGYKPKKGEDCCAVRFSWWSCYTKSCSHRHWTRYFERRIRPGGVDAPRGLTVTVMDYTWCSCENGKWNCHINPIAKFSNNLNYSLRGHPKNSEWFHVNPNQ
jgi:RHS repeat-associated protein